jgi:hypothetical protein
LWIEEAIGLEPTRLATLQRSRLANLPPPKKRSRPWPGRLSSFQEETSGMIVMLAI